MVFSASMSESDRNGLISLHFGKILVDSARNHIMMQKVEQLNGDLIVSLQNAIFFIQSNK